MPDRHSFKEAWLVVLHDLHIKKTAPPQLKYNAAQRIAYTSVALMGVGSIITGLAVYKPVQLYWLCAICGGYEAARIEHFALTIGYVLFFIVHIVQVILAGWNNFQAMVTGFEIIKDKGNTSAPAKEVSLESHTTLAAEDELHIPEQIETAITHPESVIAELPEESSDHRETNETTL